MLSWFIETWFWRKIYFEAQEKGVIPMDEIFDPMLIFEIPDRDGTFPLWLSAEPLQKIRELGESGKIRNIAPNGEWIGVDKYGNYHGINWVRINEEEGTYSKTAIHAQNFPVVESEVLSEILTFQLYEELILVINGKKAAVPIKEIIEQIDLFNKKYEIRRWTTSKMP